MKILKITCTNSGDCFTQIRLDDPTIISCLHNPNNHICMTANDYDVNGHVLKAEYLKVKSSIDENKKEFFDKVEKEFV